MCAECGILTFYEKACALTSAWMAGTPLEPDLTALEDYALNGGVFGNAENSLASRQREPGHPLSARQTFYEAFAS